ncbi:MAG: hypothetical protein KQH79_03300 [Bacteroidetes bacterium]|nr:hypothetical protein [Bacteroidota bacterium]
MKIKKNILGYYIIASAILWGITIVGVALKLKGTDCYQQISIILTLGASIHLILIWVPLAAQLKKQKEQE